MKGFTILEIMIVLSILSITAGAGYMRYAQLSQSSTLKKNAEDLGSLLTSAKTRTIRRDMTPDLNCAEFGGYEVRFTATTFRLFYICRPGGVVTTLAASPLYTLPVRTVFSLVPPVPANAPFYEPYGCVDATWPNSNCANTTAGVGTRSIQIRNDIIDSCITINVNNLGGITVGNPVAC